MTMISGHRVYPPGAVSDQVRDGREPKDRQGAAPYCAAIDFAATDEVIE